MSSHSRLLSTLVAASLATWIGCAPHPAGTGARSGHAGQAADDASQLVRLLEQPATRDAAACRLLELRKYRGKPPYEETLCDQVRGAVNHVIVAPQAAAGAAARDAQPPMYMVFRRWPFDDDAIGPGRSRGPFVLFDGGGYIVPVFQGANLIDEDANVFAYAGDTRLAIGQVISHGSGEKEDARDWTTQLLHVIPIAPQQRSVLSVILGPATYGIDDRCKGFYWGWRTRDLDADGVLEIEIGPWLSDRADDISPRAVYRWSKESARYDGPAGSIKEGFLRIDSGPKDAKSTGPQSCCQFHKPSELFALERLRLAIPATHRPSFGGASVTPSPSPSAKPSASITATTRTVARPRRYSVESRSSRSFKIAWTSGSSFQPRLSARAAV